MRGDAENPFRLPPDDQIFAIREQERQKRVEERQRVKELKVWEKTTASSRLQKTHRADFGLDETRADFGLDEALASNSAAQMQVPRLHVEKENVLDFVEKARAMFLVQMSLDVKKAEIFNLDEKVKQKEEALQKSQKTLEEDVSRFDSFLQNNEQKAHAATKEAEEKTKQKQDRIARIKMLKQQLSQIQGETAKHRDQKEESLKLKAFLVKLTPQEWKDQKEDEKRERRRLRKQEMVAQKMAAYTQQLQQEIDEEERAMQDRMQEGRGGRRRPKREAEEDAKEREREMEQRRRRIRKKYPSQEQVEADCEEESSGSEMPLYFQYPEQLLDIFTDLEEKNLFLIQNSQDMEQALEEYQTKLRGCKRTMGAKTAKAKQDIEQLERQIADERCKMEDFRQMLNTKRGASEQEQLLAALAEKVNDVHSFIRTHDSDDSADTLQLLASIESVLEKYLSQLDEAEATGRAALVRSLENAKEDERRQEVRNQKLEAKAWSMNERMKNSSKRNELPVRKKVGKQIMFRSPPLHKKERRVVQEDDGLEEQIRDYEAFKIYINKDGMPSTSSPVLAS